jgi:hypothetical protein
MKNLLLLALFAIFSSITFAQNCDLYIPYEEGTVLNYTTYNPKGKATGEHRQTLISKMEEAGGTNFVIRQENLTDKKVGPIDLKFRCEGDRFIVDMSNYIDPKTMESYKDMKVDMTVESIDIPIGAVPGMALKDGSIAMTIVSESPINMSTKIYMTNRKVEAIESVTTPAGTFECLKISQTLTTDMGIMKIAFNTIDWMAKNVGSVKSETYNKQNKLVSYQLLTGLKK